MYVISVPVIEYKPASSTGGRRIVTPPRTDATIPTNSLERPFAREINLNIAKLTNPNCATEDLLESPIANVSSMGAVDELSWWYYLKSCFYIRYASELTYSSSSAIN